MSLRRLVLVGGGHTHALVLAALRLNPLHGVEVVLVSPGQTAPYSGMLPGFVAGHYSQNALEIDLSHLSVSSGARHLNDYAVGLDPTARTLRLVGGDILSYDVISLDVGITTQMPRLPGFSTHGVPVKPLAGFAANWQKFRDQPGRKAAVVIGGGVAGAEIAMAMSFALRDCGRDRAVQLLDRSEILTEVAPAVRYKLRAALAENGVDVHENVEVIAIEADHVILQGQKRLEADLVVGAAGACAHDWIKDTELALHEGFIAVNETLQSSDSAVFAVGDCAHMTFDPRPKAGVYAVRQAPILTANLRASFTDGPLQIYTPQSDYLKLISLGRKSALGVYGGYPFSGPLVWQLKDWIDRRFMSQF